MTSTGAHAIAGVGLLACLLATGPALAELVRPLPRTLGPGHGVAVDPAQRAAARALGRAVSALDEGDLEAAGKALEAAAGAGPIADHVGLQRARWLLARGEPGAAADVARETAAAYPESPLQGGLARLRGDALAAAGEEAEARAAWTSALAHIDAAPERRAIKLAILASRQRTGDLATTEDPELLLASEFPDAVQPGELVAGKRTAEMAMRAGDALVSQGRGADAVEAYREAISAGLEGEALHDARLREGIALFGLRRYDEALRAFELLGRDPEARFWRARTLARLGRIERAVVGFEALVGTETGNLASRSAYLAATLLEDRGQRARAMALYRRVASEAADPDLALDALWRIGWSAWKRGDDAEARRRFAEMTARSHDAVDALRPRYWAARAAERGGDAEAARAGFEAIARDWPLTYYGWRAQQRLGRIDPLAADLARVSRPDAPTLGDADLARVALLLDAGLDEAARVELEPLSARARTRADHERVGRLLVAAGDYYRAQRLVVNGSATSLARGVRPGDETLLWLSWPPAFGDVVERNVAGLDRVEPALVWAIMREESSFRPEVMSSAGAMGLLQLMPQTARREASRLGAAPIRHDEELLEPDTNIKLGSAYLEYLAGRFPERLSATIGSYNAGPGAVARWLRGEAAKWEDDVWVEDIPYGQTRSYVKRVLRSLHVYRTFY